jgi:Fe-S oxidoreductase
MSVFEHFLQEKEHFLEECTRCGLCAEACPILPYTEAGRKPAGDIQAGVFDFLEGGIPNDAAYNKAFACMECFKCTAGICPEGLNPMRVNEIIKGEYISRGLADSPFSDAAEPDSAHRVLASIQVAPSEYERITTFSAKATARIVFFPGCNVYFQPEKILNSLDILDAIGHDHAFLPGLDHCCGDNHLFFGDLVGGAARAEKLVSALATFEPEAVVLWCPTCHCRFAVDIAPAVEIPFKILSFPQYLAAHMDRLFLKRTASSIVTLHEACKSAYTGVDPDGARDVLRQLPGISLREMDRHGPDTACCGSGAVCWFPQSCAVVREERLREAARTGAEQLVTVCHYCSQTFAAEEPRFGFQVSSYITLIAEAMGIRREDRFKRWAQWADPDRIVEDAAARIARSPFSKRRIVEVLESVFGK